jgi:tetratricopeptide (TPR) repeat protein
LLTRLALAVLLVAPLSHASVASQTTTEADALRAVTLATNPTTKLSAAEDFIARFPQSTSRKQVAEQVAAELRNVQNGVVALTLIERAKAIFTGEDEWQILKPVALDAFLKADRIDDAFKLANDILAKHPDDLHVLVTMTATGVEQARKRNQKYVDSSLEYGLRAIELIEAGEKTTTLNSTEKTATPNAAAKRATFNEETWSAHKPNLGQLYQQTALLYLSLANTEQAKLRLTKASALQPNDPTNFALLGRVLNAEYVEQMKTYDVMPEGQAKQETLKNLEVLLDTIIDAYARAAGLATGRAEYRVLLQQVIPDLTTYYKFRHQQTTDGLRRIIDKYRNRPKRLD